ncbi:glycosyltransferase family 4 protein [Bifidobacterium crudilactis]|jgi:spore coat protein SA|uniref:glycosyltransferase family 4 protein n=1 Tax=Bifidobacterium crudilactis TaxID=327277 RepID=UPI002F354377
MNSAKTRISIVTSGYLPVPNTSGGAVEALDTMLIRQNEKHPVFDFTVYSVRTPQAVDASLEYHRTQCVFIPIPIPIRAVDCCIYWGAKYILRKQKLMSYRFIAQRLWYIRAVAKKLANVSDDAAADAIIIENHATLFAVFKLFGNARRYAGKIYYHLHNEVTGTFGCTKEIRQVRKVLGVSQFIIDKLEERIGPLRKDQRAVWRNRVDTDAFNPDNPATQQAGIAWRRKLGIRSSETVFLFSGRLTPEKGAAELLEAFNQADIPDSRLVIAGSFFVDTDIVSPFEEHLRRLAERAGKRILFTGFVEYSQMPGIYALADICCLPSIWDDPAPLAVIEALASGRALITTRSGGIPEYVSEARVTILERDEDLVRNLTAAMRELAIENSMNLDAPDSQATRAFKPSARQEQYLLQLHQLLQC